jgi:NO-binding membrane sensor protein with MHYT domain/signal transduction histidine kinase/CheY-like chemotaxis protein
MPITGAYDATLVALSVLIATFASFTALDLAERIRTSLGPARFWWLATAALAMGGGVWAMHFVAMLALAMPFQITYDPGLTVLSLIVPVVISGVAFYLSGHFKPSPASLGASGLVMGLGFAAMHYFGMAAMQMAAGLSYDPVWVALSVLIAVGAAVAALYFASRILGWRGRVIASCFMGCAISGMHYTAMVGATFTAHVMVDGAEAAGTEQVHVALGVALVTCFILALALVTSTFSQREAEPLETGPSVPSGRAGSDLAILLGASILVPLGVFSLAAWQSWRSLEQAAEERVEKSVSLIAEHALKVFQNNEQVLNRADERLRGIPLDEIHGSYPINAYFNTLVSEVEHLNTLGVIAPNGRLLNVSRSFPALPLNFAGRDFFARSELSPVRSYVSSPTESIVGNTLVFHLARERTPENGQRSGVLFASMAPEYFARFYRTVTGGGDSVTMARSDGVVLVRDPPATTGVMVLSPGSGLMRSIAHADRGIYRSTSELDGVPHLYAYQQVGRYPVYVSYGLSLSTISQQWQWNLLAFGGVAALAALALSSLSLLALRRASRERRSFLRWQQEIERRRTAEEALRQAQKMEAVGQLTGGIAHDFNNLLTVVSGNLDFAGRALQKDNVQKARHNIEAALNGAHRAAALTHRLLAFSRRQPLAPQVINPNRLVSGMSDLFRRTLGESIRVETVLAGHVWSVFADPNQLESALLNLAINARDAMPNGGRVTIETANCHLDEAYAAASGDVTPGQYVLIAVSDTGTGMTSEVMQHVFEPFFTTKEIGQGTGLGLSMIYGFVKQSGGHIRIQSQPDKGTTVKIYLPRTSRSETGQSATRAHPPRAQSGETILVVEDDREVRAYSVESLKSLGYQVLEAKDAASALSLVATGTKIDLLFTDVGLPGRNGRQLADELARIRPHIPVLFVSGYTRDAIVQNGMLEPGVHLLNKPFTVDELAGKVREVIESMRAPV